MPRSLRSRPSLADTGGTAPLLAEFDRVIVLNDVIYPYHPRAYEPPRGRARELADLIAGERGPVTSITVQSVHTRPSNQLVHWFPGADIHVISDGLMSYGPTRFSIDRAVGRAIARVLHLDLVTGLVPVLLSEHGVPAERIDTDAFRTAVAMFDGSGSAAEADAGDPEYILLGQYLAQLDILSDAEEHGLHEDMVRVAHALGAKRAAFKPHPSAPPTHAAELIGFAETVGLTLSIIDDTVPVEVLFDRWSPRGVIGCFSTGLATATTIYGLESYSTGTEAVARRLPRFQDSNRVPLALIHALLARASVSPDGAVRVERPHPMDLQRLVNELSAAMQPQSYSVRDGDLGARALSADPQLAAFFERPAHEATKPRRSLASRVAGRLHSRRDAHRGTRAPSGSHGGTRGTPLTTPLD